MVSKAHSLIDQSEIVIFPQDAYIDPSIAKHLVGTIQEQQISSF